MKRFILVLLTSVVFIILSTILLIPNDKIIKRTKRQFKSSFLDDPNELILKYVHLPYDLSYGSNSIPLVVSALMTKGDFLELGMGSFSTPVLHGIASDQNRTLVSLDTNIEWINRFIFYNKTKNHRIYKTDNFDQLENKIGKREWGLTLVDHIEAGRRVDHAIYFANISQIVVVHDAERRNDAFYLYERKGLKSHFKYACKFSLFQHQQKISYISTLMLSNYIDLSLMENIFSKVNTDYGHVACDLSF